MKRSCKEACQGIWMQANGRIWKQIEKARGKSYDKLFEERSLLAIKGFSSAFQHDCEMGGWEADVCLVGMFRM